MPYSNEVVEALKTLRNAARGQVGVTPKVADAFNTLDNAGVFQELDEQTDYATTDEPDGGHEEYVRSMETNHP